MINFDEWRIAPGAPLQTDKWNGLVDEAARLKEKITPALSDQNLTLTIREKEDALELGVNQNHSWIQSHQNKPLAINADAGNVGIGTATPAAKLEIQGRGGVSIDLDVNGRIRSNNDNGGLWVAGDRFVGGHSTDKMGFYNRGWRLTVQNNGFIGIGITDPLYLLSMGSSLGLTKLALYQSRDGSSNYGMGVTAGKFNLNIGNPKARYAFHDSGSSNAKEIFTIYGNGNFRGGRHILASDRRLKRDIRPFRDGLKTVEKMNPVSYRFNGLANTADGEEAIGLIAQELEKTAPYMVSRNKEKLKPSDSEKTDLLHIHPLTIVYVLVNAVKELSQQLRELERQVLTAAPSSSPK